MAIGISAKQHTWTGENKRFYHLQKSVHFLNTMNAFWALFCAFFPIFAIISLHFSAFSALFSAFLAHFWRIFGHFSCIFCTPIYASRVCSPIPCLLVKPSIILLQIYTQARLLCQELSVYQQNTESV
jgi:hypothetical protein